MSQVRARICFLRLTWDVHTTGFPVSPSTPATFLVVGLSEITLPQHQRFSIPYLFAASLVMTVAAIIFRVIPI